MKQIRKMSAWILILSILITSIPVIGKEKLQQTDNISVYAKSDDTITLTKQNFHEQYNGKLNICTQAIKIKRDYSQSCNVEVKNTTDQVIEYYLVAENEYSDLSLEFIKGGSENEPLMLQPGEIQNVEMIIFAQNAEKEEYQIPISAYLLNEEEKLLDAKNVINLICESTELNFSCVQKSINQSTLAHTYQLQNNGENLSDVTVSMSGDAEQYVQFRPIISNKSMFSGEIITFTVSPDLTKMKKNNLSNLAGSIVVSSGGKQQSFDINFDTKGKEIITTTMGELAELQNGNPYAGLEIDEKSIKIQSKIKDQIEYTDIQYNMNYGTDGKINIQMNYTIQEYEGTEPDFNKDYNIQKSEDGKTITFEGAILIDEDTYEEIHLDSNIKSDQNNQRDDRKSIQYILKWVIKATDNDRLIQEYSLASEVKKYAEKALNLMAVNGNPNYSDSQKWIYNLAMLGELVIEITGKIVKLPGMSILANILLKLWRIYEESMFQLMNINLDKKWDYSRWTAIRHQIDGSQCTNRGSISVDFYAPDYINKDEKEDKPELHVTNRVFADGYVDREDTNYDYILNDEKAGESSNTGLTDVAMADILTDNLKPGEKNTLTTNYDTNPGSHAVSTDTEITLIYPGDAEISYVEEPKELQDVRIKPDFAVYTENIFTSGSNLYIGEETVLNFNTYNRGSCGGWFDLKVEEEGRVIYTQEKIYLDRFSSERFSIPWTPNKKETKIKVTLTNITVGMEEYNTENNSVEKIMIAVPYQVPEIVSITPETISTNQEVMISADVNNYQDVTNVKFYIDGENCTNIIKSGITGNVKRYWTSGGILADSEHEIKVEVFYNVGKGTTSKIEGNSKLTVIPKEWKVPEIVNMTSGKLSYFADKKLEVEVLNLDGVESVELYWDNEFINNSGNENIRNKSTYYGNIEKWTEGEHIFKAIIQYKIGDNTFASIEKEEKILVVSEEESSYRITFDEEYVNPRVIDTNSQTSIEYLENSEIFIPLSQDMYENTEDYYVRCSIDNGFLYTNLKGKSYHFSFDNSKKVTIQKTSDIQIKSIRIIQLNGEYMNYSINPKEELIFSPGEYKLQLYGEFDGFNFYEEFDVDLRKNNQIITLGKNIKILSFISVNEEELPVCSEIRLVYQLEDSNIWNSYSLGTTTSEFENDVKAILYESSFEKYKEAKNAYVYFISNDTIYSKKIKENSKELLKQNEKIILDNSDMNKITFAIKQRSNLEIEHVVISNSIMGSYTFYTDCQYVPDGSYDVVVYYKMDNIDYVQKQSIELNKQEEQILLNIGNVHEITMSWPKTYNDMGMTYVTFENTMYMKDIENKKNFFLQEGDYGFDTKLKQKNTTYSIETRKEIKDKQIISIGDTFNGKFSGIYDGVYDGGGQINVHLYDLLDQYGNELSYIYSNQNRIKAEILFTNILNNTEHYSTSVTMGSFYGSIYNIDLPNVSGEFSVEIFISVEDKSENVGSEEVVLESIELNTEELVLDKGNTEILTVSGYPENAALGDVIWTSSNESVAKVEGGVVTALSIGTAIIQAEAKGKTAFCKVIVTNPGIVSIPIKAIKLSETNMVMRTGETEKLEVAYIPSDTTMEKKITWTSSDKNIVTIDENGIVTAVGEGKAIITGTSYNNKTASCNVTVTDKIPIIDISLGKLELGLLEGHSEALIVDIDPENTTEDKAVNWTSSDESIAIVKDGVVTGVKEGIAIITAQVGEKSDSCKVIVSKKQIPITKISLSRTSLQLEERGSETLTVSITPENTTEDKTITWISSDESIVTVKDGVVTGIKEGTATVTAKIGEKSAICDVVVTKKPEIEKPLSISYRTHVQNIGWQNFVSDGVMSGSKGKGLRLEGIEIHLDNNKTGGSVEYRTHVQNVGWQDYVADGAMAGTKGKSLRLEAIQMRLTGDVSKKYDVYYRTHIQDYGWLGWTMNDGKSGSQGLSKRLEGIEIRLVEKGGAAPGSTDHPYMTNAPVKVSNPSVIYTTHVQNIGWQSEVQDGTMAGTKGRGLRLEGIKIRLNGDGLKGGVEYSTHVQNIGWQSYVSDGVMSGTSGKGLRLEGIKIRLTGEIAQKYSIEYRTHVQNEGWQKWVKDGAMSGTSGKSLRLEGIEIRLAKK